MITILLAVAILWIVAHTWDVALISITQILKDQLVKALDDGLLHIFKLWRAEVVEETTAERLKNAAVGVAKTTKRIAKKMMQPK